ncbi:type II toxin-antitoxin system VapC family toxin [Aliivibrio sifiae]|nr:PIN domain-containing protein [Aliivibrio sifiae]
MTTRIVNIRHHTPHHTDRFFIDTNVWFWLTYAASNEIQTQNAPIRYQLEAYPNFIEKILDEGANIYHSPLALSELANIIERTEYDIYLSNHSVHLTRKQFRKETEHRKKVMQEVSNAWQQITQMSETLDITLNKELSTKALTTLSEHQLDAYDAFYIESMSRYNVTNIVTDDSDFNGLDISLYTANNQLV